MGSFRVLKRQPVGWVERQRNPSSFAALSQIGREEKAAAADKVSSIVRYRASIAQLSVMGFVEPVMGPATSGRTRWLHPSYGLRANFEPSTLALCEHPANRGTLQRQPPPSRRHNWRK